MKKRVLVIFIIILVIILVPRYNRSGHQLKANHSQRHPNRKVRKNDYERELPFPGKWLLNIISYNEIREHNANKSLFIPAGNNYTYLPAQVT